MEKNRIGDSWWRHDSCAHVQNNRILSRHDDHPRFVQSRGDAVTDVLFIYFIYSFAQIHTVITVKRAYSRTATPECALYSQGYGCITVHQDLLNRERSG